MPKLIVVFRNFGNSPKKIYILEINYVLKQALRPNQEEEEEEEEDEEEEEEDDDEEEEEKEENDVIEASRPNRLSGSAIHELHTVCPGNATVLSECHNTKLRAGQPRGNGGSTRRFYNSTEQLWGPPSLLFNTYRVLFPRG
jgi:thiamine pyrophosphate-dependent acetolactate synthase large subunit-like protein